MQSHLNIIETMSQEKLIGQASQEQVDAWKQEHGDVFEVRTDGHVCYLRKPKRNELPYIQKVAQTNGIKSNELLMKACWLGGSEEVQNNDAMFYGVCDHLQVLIEKKQAELVKL